MQDHGTHTCSVASALPMPCEPLEALHPLHTYEAPRVFDVGTAVSLVQGSITGKLRDGHPNGWYFYGS